MGTTLFEFDSSISRRSLYLTAFMTLQIRLAISLAAEGTLFGAADRIGTLCVRLPATLYTRAWATQYDSMACMFDSERERKRAPKWAFDCEADRAALAVANCHWALLLHWPPNLITEKLAARERVRQKRVSKVN